MKYFVTIDDERIEVELIERDDRTVLVRDGNETPVELCPIRNGGSFSLLVGDASLPLVVSGPNEDLTLNLGSETWHCSVEDEREAAASAAAGGAGPRQGGGVLRSVMPGIVREIRVAKGDRVARGDTLLILEAMKMQNEIRADADGTVVQVQVTTGAAVAKGDPLVTID